MPLRAVMIGDRKFTGVRPYGPHRGAAAPAPAIMATTYWLDVTEDLASCEDLYYATRPVVAILTMDNYEDLMPRPERQRPLRPAQRH